MTTAIGIAALVLLLSWVFSGFMLRLGGLLPVVAGVLGMTLFANSDGILMSVVGTVLWLFGHGHYALRHGSWKSRIAGSLWWATGAVFLRLRCSVAAGLTGRSAKENLPATGSQVEEGRGWRASSRRSSLICRAAGTPRVPGIARGSAIVGQLDPDEKEVRIAAATSSCPGSTAARPFSPVPLSRGRPAPGRGS